MILDYYGRSERVPSVIKTRLDNDMTDRIGVVYTENGTKLSWSIESSVDCDENHIGK